VDPNTMQPKSRRSLRGILTLTVHIPSMCLLLIVLGLVKSAWTAAVIIIGAVSLLIGVALAWGLRQSRHPDA